MVYVHANLLVKGWLGVEKRVRVVTFTLMAQPANAVHQMLIPPFEARDKMRNRLQRKVSNSNNNNKGSIIG